MVGIGGESSFIPFKDFIREIKMGKIAFKGRRWLWEKNRKGFIEERLRMFSGSAKCMVDFDKAVVQHILNKVSDHSMLM